MTEKSELEDIIDNPHKYGAPTFAEFSQNPDKYRHRMDRIFSMIEKGPTGFNGLLKKIRIFYRGESKTYKCKTLVEVQKIAQSEGVHESLLDVDVQWKPSPDGHEIHATFFRKPLVPGLLMGQ